MTACNALRQARLFLNDSQFSVFKRCSTPGYRLKRSCPVGWCNRGTSDRCAHGDALNGLKDAVKRYVNIKCRARNVDPAEMAALLLRRGTLIGRAGNGELKESVQLDRELRGRRFYASRVNERARCLGLGRVPLNGTWLGYLGPNDTSSVVQASRDYSNAVADADVEQLWDTQCMDHLNARCYHEYKVRLPRNARSLVPQQTSAALGRIDHMISYNMSLGFWLPVLELLARHRTRVLVVSGFAASIEHQIPKLSLIHPNYDLSGLTFRVVAAPMQCPDTMSTPGWPMPEDPTENTWARNLARLRANPEWDARRNDIAIIGCGPMGMPVARFAAKERNISSVYIGGFVQVIFGIVGQRYLDTQGTGLGERGVINEHWIRPLPAETPPNLLGMEGGAYW